MRTLFPKIMGAMMLVFIISCEDETEQIVSKQKAVVEFQLEEILIPEGDTEGANVLLSFNRAATEAGSIKLVIDQDMQQRIQTTPAHAAGVLMLSVPKGVSQVQFSVKGVDNTEAEGDKVVKLSLEPTTGFMLGEKKTLQVVIKEDDSASPAFSLANFDSNQQTISEDGEGIQVYKILFTPAVTASSNVVIGITTDNAATFTTNPVSVNSTVTLHAPVGTTELSFTMAAINNSDFNGDTKVEFTILSTDGSVVKGTQLKQDLTITDDELKGMLKAYETSSGDGTEKRTYEYNSKGQVAKIRIERNAPHNPTTLTETYFYDEQDRLVKVNLWLGRDIIYSWNNNRIERADVYQDGVLIQYANYAYDAQGNVAGVEPFYKQQDGIFRRGLFSIYLYFTDGNVYKALTYNDSQNSDEPVLVTTRTYDQYTNVSAPISMVEILPNVKAQKHLAGSYRMQNHSIDLDMLYSITYEFRPDGKPSKRIASAPGDTQTVVYHYY